MLQEQSEVYGSIVIHPKETLVYDKEVVLMLSD
jgi:FtsP/CotA-like multicopper oxidase with cupredoxin domain